MSADHAFLSDEHKHEMLKPLLEDGNKLDIEYRHQYKMLTEFSKRLQSLETLYAQVYSKMTQLEKELSHQKNDDIQTIPQNSPQSGLWDNFS
jgi:hypothetical protein